MTNLRWDRPGWAEPDPGAVVSVPDVTVPYKPPPSAEEVARKRRANAKRARKAALRSDQIRLEAINKKRAKFGRPPLARLPSD
jgi:hypothetical protein